MKHAKGVLGALMAALIAGSNVWALDIDLSKIKVDGNFDVKAQSAKNEVNFKDTGGGTAATASDKRNTTRHRLSLGIGGKLNDDVSARVEVVRRPLTPAGSTVGQFGQPAQTLDNETAALTLHNAYIDAADVVFGINARAGRQYVGSAESLLYYAGHYDDDDLTVTSVDGVKLDRKFGPVDLGYLHATVRDTKALAETDYTTSDNRIVFRSLSGGVDIAEVADQDQFKLPVSLAWHHAVSQLTQATSDDINLGTWELNVGATFLDEMVNVGFNWAGNDGQRNVLATPGTKVNYEGDLTVLKAGVNLKEAGLKAGIEFANASGDTGSTANKDKSFHDYSGFTVAQGGLSPKKSYGEILGRSNVTGGAVAPLLQGLDNTGAGAVGRGISVTAFNVAYTLPVWEDKVGVGLDYITAEVDKLLAADATTLKKDIGDEIDLSLSYKKSDDLNFRLGAAQFSPEKNSVVLGNPTSDDEVTKYFAHASLRF